MRDVSRERHLRTLLHRVRGGDAAVVAVARSLALVTAVDREVGGMTRICITGGPRTGKTTLANDMHAISSYDGCTPAALRHTDDLIEQCRHLGKEAWSEASRIASAWLDEQGPWIIEGVAVSRALRKWRDAHPGERPPVDRVILLTEHYERLTPGQLTMSKGVLTVHDEIDPWLLKHGILTERPSSARQQRAAFRDPA